MAVKKSDTENEEMTGVDSLANEAENVENGAQMQPQTAKRDMDKVKLIYIGPVLPKAALKTNKIFEGTQEEIKKELAPLIEKFPLVERLLVPVVELAEKKEKVRTEGNILNKYYSDLDSVVAAELKKEE